MNRISGRQPIRSFPLLLGAIVILSLANVSCGKDKGLGFSGGGGAAGKVFRYALQNRPTNLDPARVEDGDTIDFLQSIFEGLVKWSETNEVVPNLAEKWDISQDGRTYTFHLKGGVHFHQPFSRTVTATDFVYSMTRALADKTSPTAKAYLIDIVGAQLVVDGTAAKVEGLRAIDDKTLQITLDKPKAYFLGKLTYPTGWVLCKEAVEKNEGKVDEKSMIGTGPFVLKEYKTGYSVSMTANAEYHGGKPIIEGIERPILTDSIARQTKYESGGIDLTDIQRGDYSRVKQDPVLGKEIKVFDRAAIWYLAMNQLAFPPFKKKEVRQAFAYAINKEQIMDRALQGLATKANGIIPPGVPGYDPAYKGIGYDPAKARELLAKGGFPGGKGFPHLVITYRKEYKHIEDAAVLIRSDLKENLGIDVDILPVEWGQFLTQRTAGTMPCYHLRWAADYLDPQNFLSFMLRTGAPENRIGYSNPEFDRLCDEADGEQNHEKRLQLYRKAEQIAIDDAPWVAIYFQKDPELIKPAVSGIRDGLLGHLPHVTTTITR